MDLKRRAASFVSVVCVGILSTVGTSIAVQAQPAGLLAAGNYTFTNVDAGGGCCGGPGQLNLSVSQFTNMSNPLVGASTSVRETDISFFICDFTNPTNPVCGGGCFVAAPGDFTVASDLSSATLDAVFDGSQPHCTAQFSGPYPSFNPPIPSAMRFTASWANVGPIASSSNVSRYDCGAYRSETQQSNSFAEGTTQTAQITIPSLPYTASVGPLGVNLSSTSTSVHAQGTAGDNCVDLGQKGAGGGPLGPGNYQHSVTQGFVTVPATGTPFAPINLSVISFNTISSPRGGSPTTQGETDLNISSPGFPPAVQGCFVLQPGQFSVSGTGVAVHAAIDMDGTATTPPTPQCEFSSAFGLPDEFTVDATWTAAGAVSSLNSNSTFTCRTLVLTSSDTSSSFGATASGQLSSVDGTLAVQFDSVSGGVVFNDATTTHVVAQPTC